MCGLCLVISCGIIDYLSGVALSFSLFYLVPISLGSWYANRRVGLFLSLLSAITWYIADAAGAGYDVRNSIGYWNSGIRLGFFVVVTVLLTALRRALTRVSELTMFDALTGAYNSATFKTLLQTEVTRAQRYAHPFTLAYIDLDNFKTVNDTHGHQEGDRVLRNVVTVVKTGLRHTDVLGRLGGDEFALLLPETNALAAQNVIQKVRADLLASMHEHNWPVTFSMGVITQTPSTTMSTESLLNQADALMYDVKRGSKNAVKYHVNTSEPPVTKN